MYHLLNAASLFFCCCIFVNHKLVTNFASICLGKSASHVKNSSIHFYRYCWPVLLIRLMHFAHTQILLNIDTVNVITVWLICVTYCISSSCSRGVQNVKLQILEKLTVLWLSEMSRMKRKTHSGNVVRCWQISEHWDPSFTCCMRNFQLDNWEIRQ